MNLLLVKQSPLEPRHRDHPLKGKWRGYRGCHVADDWVLVYRIDGDKLRLMLVRMLMSMDNKRGLGRRGECADLFFCSKTAVCDVAPAVDDLAAITAVGVSWVP